MPSSPPNSRRVPGSDARRRRFIGEGARGRRRGNSLLDLFANAGSPGFPKDRVRCLRGRRPGSRGDYLIGAQLPKPRRHEKAGERKNGAWS